MVEESARRKLSAILSADVKGFSRLMSQDEEATVKTLKQHRATISGLVSEHRGRVVDSPGDNILAEFGSVVDAVRCAVKIQETLKGKNAELIENRRMEFRIGVNLGDVIEEEERIYGDGVNIAARLEGLAEGSGICVSGTAFDHVKNKLSVGYQYLGKQTVKNIPDPVRAYKVLMEPGAAGKVIGEREREQTRWGWKAAAAAAVLIFVVGGLVWSFYWRAPKIEPASKEKMALPLPDKPSIAVLPFVNMSGDPKQEYLADGITEDIITTLSKVPNVFVIARNSTFTYKGKHVKVQQVAEDLGIRYVLEGSVQRSGDRVRITAQFIDAVMGNHLWAERFDRDLKEFFAIKDEVTIKIIGSVRGTLSSEEWRAPSARGASNLEAYEKTMEGIDALERLGGGRDDIALARKKFEEAIALDPQWSLPYHMLSNVYFASLRFGADPHESLKNAYEYAQKAISLDEADVGAYLALVQVYAFQRRYEEAIAAGERVVKVAPGSPGSYVCLGRALLFAGRYKEALVNLERALRMNPVPQIHYLMDLGIAHAFLRNYEEAVSFFNKALSISPKFLNVKVALIVIYVEMGRLEEARAEAKELLMIDPKWNSEAFIRRSPWKDPQYYERWTEAFRKVGLLDEVSKN